MDTVLGKALFERLWVSAPSSTKAADGLGPLFNARACSSCHEGGGRAKVSLQEGDLPASAGLTLRVGAVKDGALVPHPLLGSQVQTFAVPGLKPESKLHVSFETHVETLSDGTTVELRRPRIRIDGQDQLADLAWISPRLAPDLHGGRLAGTRAADLARRAGRSRRPRRRRHLRRGGDGPVWRAGHRARPLRLEGRRARPRAPDLRRLPLRPRPLDAAAARAVGRLHDGAGGLPRRAARRRQGRRRGRDHRRLAGRDLSARFARTSIIGGHRGHQTRPDAVRRDLAAAPATIRKRRQSWPTAPPSGSRLTPTCWCTTWATALPTAPSTIPFRPSPARTNGALPPCGAWALVSQRRTAPTCCMMAAPARCSKRSCGTAAKRAPAKQRAAELPAEDRAALIAFLESL